MGRKPHPIKQTIMKEQKERQRKEYSKNGSAQKMVCFRADLDVAKILATVANKGRLINELVKEWYRSQNRAEVDFPPEENDIPIE